jgi:CubicO group peptidase (beta-lactamase class C family)
MDSNMLVELLKIIKNEELDIDGLVIVRNGSVVLNVTVFPFSIIPHGRHEVYSCSKSILSILIGIAIEEGYIAGVDEPVLSFFPEKTLSNLGPRKSDMTLEHLLTMATGMACRDSYLYGWEGLHQMQLSEDWVQFMLSLAMVEDPGSRFEYCNGASFLLAAILQESTGMTAFEFANKVLFSELGITNVTWEYNPQDINLGYSGVELAPEDLAKIGQLYLNGGVWDGKQVVPTEWVEASIQKRIRGTLQEWYGYQWWLDDSGIYMALGYGGQYLIVVPEENLVVVFVSDLAENDFYLPEQLLHAYILPAIQSSSPLEENERATKLLRLYRLALKDG